MGQMGQINFLQINKKKNIILFNIYLKPWIESGLHGLWYIGTMARNLAAVISIHCHAGAAPKFHAILPMYHNPCRPLSIHSFKYI